jgi:hypothetical protein
MKCQNCQSERIIGVGAKCSDLFQAIDRRTGREKLGYVPKNLEIGGGDYIDFEYCMDCGRIQGQFPINDDVLSDFTD